MTLQFESNGTHDIPESKPWRQSRSLGGMLTTSTPTPPYSRIAFPALWSRSGRWVAITPMPTKGHVGLCDFRRYPNLTFNVCNICIFKDTPWQWRWVALFLSQQRPSCQLAKLPNTSARQLCSQNFAVLKKSKKMQILHFSVRCTCSWAEVKIIYHINIHKYGIAPF